AAPFGTMPASRPRQPTCSSAIAGRPSRRAIATGRQSAVTTTSGSPCSSVQSPSPGAPRPSALLTRAPWTWSGHVARSGRAPVELAVQLAPLQLGEDLPDPRRLAEAELREIGPADREPYAPQAREVVADRGQLLEREREERCVGVVALEEVDELRGRGPVP